MILNWNQQAAIGKSSTVKWPLISIARLNQGFRSRANELLSKCGRDCLQNTTWANLSEPSDLASEGCAIIYYQVPKYQVLAFATPFRAKHIRPSSRRYRLLTSPANRPSASLTCKLRRAKEQRAAAASGRTSVSLPLSRLPPSECS